jgi:hypothetical protein
MKGSITGRLAFFLLAIAGLWFLLWLRAHQPPNTVDDAYITFRYARNLINGVGFVYNAGERVLGTTTPAYTLLLALSALIGGFTDFPKLALVLNAGCDALTFCLLLQLGARLSGNRGVGLIAALLFTLDARLLDFSTGGMESSFNLLAIVATLTLFFHGRYSLAALAAGLAVLIRPDGATLAAALFAALGLPVLRRPARWPWREAALFLAVVLPWLLFAFAYFGQPIPQSVLAKSVVYRMPDDLAAFRAFLVQLRTVFAFSLPPLNDPEPVWRQMLQALLPLGLCGLGLFAAQRRHSRAWMLGVYIVLFIAFFSVGNPLWLGWYEIPLLPLYQLLILLAADWVGERVGASRAQSPISKLQLSLFAALLLSMPQLSRLNALPWEQAERPRFVVNSSFNKEREADYVTLAQMLAPAARAGRQVAIPEIGAFGYWYPGKIFDTTGLVTPAIHKYFPIPPEIPVGLYTVPRRMILDEQPDLFITFDSFIAEDLRPDAPDFLALYTPTIGLVSRATWPVQRLVVYRRRDLPLEADLPAWMTPLPVSFDGDRLRLEGYRAEFGQTPEYRYLEVTLVWRNGPQALERDYLVQADLLDADGQTVFQILNFPGEALFPTRDWRPGQILIDRYPLKLPNPGAGPYSVRITLLDEATGAAVMSQVPARADSDGNSVIIHLPERSP